MSLPHPESKSRFTALLFTDIVGSTDLKARYGVPAYAKSLAVHNDHFERLGRQCTGLRILQNMGDGYFAEASEQGNGVRSKQLTDKLDSNEK